jgi:hypothetical protein
LAQLNYYNHSRTIGWICQERMEHPPSLYELMRPKQVEVFSQLAQLTGITPEEILAASEHRFSSVLTAPWMENLDKWLQLLSAVTTFVSPRLPSFVRCV